MATIQEVYIALFGRPADPVGYNFYVEATNDGANLDAVGSLANSPEYLNRFEGQNDVQTVNQIFLDLFGHDADAAGLLFYVNLLQSGQATIQDIAIRILDGASGTDQDVIDAKVVAAQAFTDSLDTGSEIVAYQGEQGITFGQAFLAQIQTGDDVLTQAEIDAQIADFVATGVSPGEDPNAPSNQVNFTAAIGEQLVGTDANDAFNGVVDAAGTVNVGDTVNGGTGTDTLNLLVAAPAGNVLPAGFTSTNVEIVNVTYTGAGTIGPINSTSFSGVEQIWQIDNVAGDTFADVTVGTGVTAGFRSTGNASNAVAAAVTVTAAAGVTSAAIALDGVATGSNVTLAETTAAGLSTVSVTGSFVGTPAVAGIDANADGDFVDVGDTAPVAAANGTLTLSAAGTTDIDTLNLSISSNGTVVIANLDDLNTFNASASTGNLTVGFGAPDELSSATFGSGNDNVTISTASLNAATTAVTIDLGAGNDVLNFNAAANANANAVSITLGAGNDTFAVTGLANITATTAVAADLVTIVDFNDAQDVLDLSALGARDIIINTEQANITAAANLEAALEVAAQATTNGGYSVFNYGGDAYVLNDNGGAGFDAGDGLIKITGFQVEEITAQNFIA